MKKLYPAQRAAAAPQRASGVVGMIYEAAPMSPWMPSGLTLKSR